MTEKVGTLQHHDNYFQRTWDMILKKSGTTCCCQSPHPKQAKTRAEGGFWWKSEQNQRKLVFKHSLQSGIKRERERETVTWSRDWRPRMWGALWPFHLAGFAGSSVFCFCIISNIESIAVFLSTNIWDKVSGLINIKDTSWRSAIGRKVVHQCLLTRLSIFALALLSFKIVVLSISGLVKLTVERTR